MSPGSGPNPRLLFPPVGTRTAGRTRPLDQTCEQSALHGEYPGSELQSPLLCRVSVSSPGSWRRKMSCK